MGAARGHRGAGLILLCLLCLLAPLAALGEGEPEAEDLTRRVVFTLPDGQAGKEARLTDGKQAKAVTLGSGEGLTIEAPSGMGTLILRLNQFGAAFTLRQVDGAGNILQEGPVETESLILTLDLTEGCRRAEILAGKEPVKVSEAYVFGPGALPDPVPHPTAPVEKADFLLVATHPDDEWVFLGGVYPTYGGERGLTGTVVYMTLPSFGRAHEAMDGLWIGGMGTHPFFLGFPDIGKNARDPQRSRVPQADVTLALVRLYRQIRPLVVVTQDPKNGEYGHWQHKLSAKAALEAVELAADPAYDPDSAAQYGTWTVRKVYQHFAKGLGSLVLDVKTPLARYGGRTALQVARAAFKAHSSQQDTKYRPGSSDATKGDITHFGLTWSAVGADTGADLFEHIPEKELAANLPTASPVLPAGKMGEVPSASEAEGVLESTPTSRPTPTPGPWDKAEEGARWAADRAAPMAGTAVAVLALAVAGKQYRRGHHRKKKEK